MSAGAISVDTVEEVPHLIVISAQDLEDVVHLVGSFLFIPISWHTPVADDTLRLEAPRRG